MCRTRCVPGAGASPPTCGRSRSRRARCWSLRWPDRLVGIAATRRSPRPSAWCSCSSRGPSGRSTSSGPIASRYILLKPNWRSWLVWGAWILMAFGAVGGVWLLGGFGGGEPRGFADRRAGHSAGAGRGRLQRVPVRPGRRARFLAEPARAAAPGRRRAGRRQRRPAAGLDRVARRAAGRRARVPAPRRAVAYALGAGAVPVALAARARRAAAHRAHQPSPRAGRRGRRAPAHARRVPRALLGRRRADGHRAADRSCCSPAPLATPCRSPRWLRSWPWPVSGCGRICGSRPASPCRFRRRVHDPSESP